MMDFKAKMHQIRFRLGSAPDPAGGAYSAPQTPCWIWSRFAAGGGAGLGKKGKEGGAGEGGRAPKLLLNQGPSERCYAIVSLLLKY